MIIDLASKYTVDDINAFIFKHPRFTKFLKIVSNFSDGFLRSTVLNMMETLCSEKTYNSKDINNLSSIRTELRATVTEMLEGTLSEDAANFLLELLLIFTSSKDDPSKITKQKKKLKK